jgi:hypothetical protein
VNVFTPVTVSSASATAVFRYLLSIAFTADKKDFTATQTGSFFRLNTKNLRPTSAASIETLP